MSPLRSVVLHPEDHAHPVEDALFEALCRVHALPAEQAVVATTLAASSIGAFLGDLARLDPRPQVAALARAELASLHEDCGRLLEDLARQGA